MCKLYEKFSFSQEIFYFANIFEKFSQNKILVKSFKNFYFRFAPLCTATEFNAWLFFANILFFKFGDEKTFSQNILALSAPPLHQTGELHSSHQRAASIQSEYAA